MEQIRSERHTTNFYLAISARMFFFLVMALLVGGLHSQALSQTKEVIMLLMSAGLVIMAIYTPICYYKNAPSISLNNTTITVGNNIYNWNDIEKIELTGKKHFKFLLMGHEKEALTLKFPGMPELVFFDEIYANSALIKTFINDNVINKEAKLFKDDPLNRIETLGQIKHIYNNKTSPDTVVYYKGNPLLSFDSLTKWFMILIFLVPVPNSILTHKFGLAVASLLPSSLFYIYLSSRFYYFGISDSLLLIRNNDRFWFHTAFPLQDIREVVFDQWSLKIPVTLRIITNNFETKAFLGGTLKNKHWQQLKNDLEAKGIKVRVDCNIGLES